jgi:hypothetical protein
MSVAGANWIRNQNGQSTSSRRAVRASREPRELNTLVGCSKRLIAGRPVKASFRERKVTLRHVPEANGFGTSSLPRTGKCGSSLKRTWKGGWSSCESALRNCTILGLLHVIDELTGHVGGAHVIGFIGDSCPELLDFLQSYLFCGEHAKLWAGLIWRDEMEDTADCRRRFLGNDGSGDRYD